MSAQREAASTPCVPLQTTAIAPESGGGYPEPFQSRMGEGHWRRLGDAFGLTQFGISLETLQPGAQSALRHWHTLADELVYMLEGTVTLHTNAGASALTAGMCVGFKAGVADAHHLVNDSGAPASYLVMGSRVPGDNAFYPDDDVVWVRTAEGHYPAHKDGRPYWLPGQRPT
jgi:uncharacterized cupin superfamily protein